MVVEGLMERPYDVGTLRQKPVVIRDPRTVDNIVFMPPDHWDVSKLCDDLFGFIQQQITESDPILLAGLFHKQAVIIHPFMDGNGRTTRLMTSAILGMAGLDFFSIFSFEMYYNQNVTRYFKEVGEIGDYYDLQEECDFTHWLGYFSEGILDELKRVQKTLPQNNRRLQPHHKLILDYIHQHNAITQKEYATISSRSLAARKNDFSYLIEQNLIRKQGGGRSVYYQAV